MCVFYSHMSIENINIFTDKRRIFNISHHTSYFLDPVPRVKHGAKGNSMASPYYYAPG